MYISKFYRIDTTTFPGMYLSVVELSSGEGYGTSATEVANTVSSDRDSIDALMFTRRDGEILELEGLHRLIRELRPPHMSTILRTGGALPHVLDDLVGAGYVSHVLFRIEDPLTEEQARSVEIARTGDCVFSAEIMMDPARLDEAALAAIGEALTGARTITLRRVIAARNGKQFRKNEMTSMAKSLKGAAREVRVS